MVLFGLRAVRTPHRGHTPLDSRTIRILPFAAPRAGTAGRSHSRSCLRQYRQPSAPDLIERHDVLGKAAGRGAEIEPATFDLGVGAKQLLCDQGVQHRLQRRAAGHQLARLSLSLAGLVIRYSHQTGWMAFDEIDRATELDAAVEVVRRRASTAGSAVRRSSRCSSPNDSSKCQGT